MSRLLQSIRDHLPPVVADWFDVLVPSIQIILIMLCAWLVMRIAHRLIQKLTGLYSLSGKVAPLLQRVVAFVVYGGASLWSLERIGVSSTVLWTAFTGFATVGAVAFFAAWSVLSNVFCALLIFTTRVFRIGDLVELLENGEKPGIKGRVIDINLVYTTLHEAGDEDGGTTLQLPNSLFFQRILRRWYGNADESSG